MQLQLIYKIKLKEILQIIKIMGMLVLFLMSTLVWEMLTEMWVMWVEIRFKRIGKITDMEVYINLSIIKLI